VASFARALGADSADGVPPTFAAVYALGTTARLLFDDPAAAIDFAHLLHTDQEFEWARPARVGETVAATGRIISDLSRRGVRLVTFESVVVSAGEWLCTSRARFAIQSPAA
jgi:hypothetical protein